MITIIHIETLKKVKNILESSLIFELYEQKFEIVFSYNSKMVFKSHLSIKKKGALLVFKALRT